MDLEAELARPRFVMMVGVYASGKSTWSKAFIERLGIKTPYVRISGEEIIAEFAAERGISTRDVYADDALRAAYIAEVEQRLVTAANAGQNIVFDSTNINPQFRSRWLELLQESGHPYFKIAACLLPSDEEALSRLHQRNEQERHNPLGQQVSDENFYAAMASYSSSGLPTLAEGFDSVLSVPTEAARREAWIKTVGQSAKDKGIEL